MHWIIFLMILVHDLVEGGSLFSKVISALSPTVHQNDSSIMMYDDEGFVRYRTQNETCVLPEYPANGTYITDEHAKNGKPGDAYKFVKIEIVCDQGFALIGPAELYCFDDVWSDLMPKCISLCYLPPQSSVIYSCVDFGRGIRPCDQLELNGTVVIPKCRSHNYYTPTVHTPMLCINGKWNYTAKCSRECGKVSPISKLLVANGRTAKRSEVPWHAGIYTTTKRPYKQICGGSLISNYIVLSAAHCFWNSSGSEQQPAGNFAVAVGKLYRPWTDDNDKDNEQKSNVTKLHLPPLYQSSAGNNQADIAVVVLAEPFQFTKFVQPVCVDFEVFQNSHLKFGNIGMVGGWGLTAANETASQLLKAIDLPFVSAETCINEAPLNFRGDITIDKFCAGYINENKGVCQGDSGGGLAFPELKKSIPRFFLRGVVSTAPATNDQCNTNFYSTFTQILNYEHLIKPFLVYGAQCYLPPDHSVKYRCLADGAAFRDCGEFENNGAVVYPQCRRPYYYSATVLTHMRCKNGKWTYIAKCSPECGKIASLGLQLFIGGQQSAKRSEIPWHAGIYTTTTNPYQQICGGSLISDSIVLSAAHCFWNKLESKPLPAEEFAVAVGKFFRPWSYKSDKEYEQKSDVKAVHLAPSSLRSTATHQDSDIAVVVLATPVRFTMYVRPVCVDFDSFFEKIQLIPGTIGKVAGWMRRAINAQPSNILNVFNLPLVNTSTCISESSLSFHGNNNSDKICARYKYELALCENNGGSSFVFPQWERGSMRFYLRGVASTAPVTGEQCIMTNYTPFTKISNHEGFIKQFLENEEFPCKEESLSGNYYETPRYSMASETLNHATLERDSAGLKYFEMHVAVQADGFVGIGLYDKKDQSDVQYYIYIGTNGNESTDLYYPWTTVRRIKTLGILSPAKFKTFYIKVYDGKLEFGLEGDSSPLITHYDDGFRSLNYYMFYYGGHHKAKIRYDCPVEGSS